MYYSNYSSDLDAVFATLGIAIVIILIIAIPFVILYLVGLWKLFRKAGKNGWEAIIPFYNTWVLVEISGLSWWYALIILSTSIVSFLGMDNLSGLCNLASLVASFFCYYNISKKLHKDTGFAILMTLFSGIVIPLVGLSNSYSFDHSVPVSENGPINQNSQSARGNSDVVTTDFQSINDSSNARNTASVKFCPYCGKQLDENVKFCGNCGKEV